MKYFFPVACSITFAAFFAKAVQPAETFSLTWPAAEHWKVAVDQDDAATHMVLLVHANETEVAWTELANMTTQKTVTGVPVEAAMQQIVEQQKKELSKPVITFLEKDASAKYPWILFSIESAKHKKSGTPESQLWYVVQGKENLYTNFIALKTEAFSATEKDKWGSFFKSGKVIE